MRPLVELCVGVKPEEQEGRRTVRDGGGGSPPLTSSAAPEVSVASACGPVADGSGGQPTFEDRAAARRAERAGRF